MCEPVGRGTRPVVRVSFRGNEWLVVVCDGGLGLLRYSLLGLGFRIPHSLAIS
jgi:hypothetical protein